MSGQRESWAVQAHNHADPSPTAPGREHLVSRRLGPEACASIIDRYARGETAKVLAEEHGVARNAILNLLRSNGVTVRRQPPTDAQRQRFADEYEGGATIAEIAKRTGFSFGSVQKALHAAGVRMRPRGKVAT